MPYETKPLPFDLKSISGISEKVLVSHYNLQSHRDSTWRLQHRRNGKADGLTAAEYLSCLPNPYTTSELYNYSRRARGYGLTTQGDTQARAAQRWHCQSNAVVGRLGA
ncbi:hypothetical protein ACVMAJ_006955 [Bradyrhizobium sp. USDA 4448]